MRILGLDYGSKTCGVAISDESETISSPVETIRYKEMSELIKAIKKYIEEYEIKLIVLGNPLNLDGSISTRSEETFKFKEKLEKEFNIQVILEDERLTTVIVNNMLIEGNTRRENRKKVVDKLAASIILESYLDRSKHGK